MKTMKKTFDCVDMKRKVQEKIYEETKSMNAGQLIDYFHRRVHEGPFARQWKKGLSKKIITDLLRKSYSIF